MTFVFLVYDCYIRAFFIFPQNFTATVCGTIIDDDYMKRKVRILPQYRIQTFCDVLFCIVDRYNDTNIIKVFLSQQNAVTYTRLTIIR